MAAFEGIGNKIMMLWFGMTGAQRLVLVCMAAALIISVLVFGLWIQKPDLAVLATGIDLTSAGDVIKELDGKNVEYKVTDGGRTILVPREMVSELRVLLASTQTLGVGQAGYELFDNEKLGITEFAQKINLQRALQGELSRTITELKAVDRARVHIAIPKENVFLDEEKEPTASVVIKLKPGKSLTGDQIQGIANLVSFSVEGLESGGVSIVDDNGNILKGSTNDMEAATSAQLEEQRTIEQYLSNKAETLLAKIVGSGHARVAVNADLNWEQMEQTKEYYDPERSSVRSEQTNSSNSPTDNSQSESSVLNYELDKTIEHVLSAVGTIKQLSVSAFVDDAATVGDDGAIAYQPRSEDELQKFNDIVRNAVGFDAGRGDKITVVNMRFTSDNLMEDNGGILSSPLLQVLPSILGKLIAVVIALILFLTIKKMLSQGGLSLGGRAGSSAGVSGESGGMSGGYTSMNVEDRAKSLALSNPENAANLMKAWLGEAVGSSVEE
jgi:flagellar M-ring protein FliF